MKKLLVLIITAVLLVSALPIGASADNTSAAFRLIDKHFDFSYKYGQWDPFTHTFVSTSSHPKGWDCSTGTFTLENTSSYPLDVTVVFEKSSDPIFKAVSGALDKSSARVDVSDKVTFKLSLSGDPKEFNGNASVGVIKIYVKTVIPEVKEEERPVDEYTVYPFDDPEDDADTAAAETPAETAAVEEEKAVSAVETAAVESADAETAVDEETVVEDKGDTTDEPVPDTDE